MSGVTGNCWGNPGLQEYDYRVLSKTGELRDVVFRKATFCDASGNVAGIVGAILDITDRKRTEEALRRSEERLRLAMEATSDGLWDWNLESGDAYWSPRCFTMLGYEPGEFPVSFEKWSGLLHPEDRAATVSAVREQLRKLEGNFTVEFRALRKDGTWHWVMGRGKTVEWTNGAPRRVIGTHVDISGAKHAEQVLRREKERARQYLDLVGTAVIAIGADERVALVNRAGCRLLEASEERILGRNWFDSFVPDRLRENTKEMFHGLMAGEIEEEGNAEHTILTARGEQRLVCWHNAVIRDASGRITHALSAGEDITARKAAEEALERERAELHAVYDNAPVMLCVLDSAGTLLFGNRAYSEFTGTGVARPASAAGCLLPGCVNGLRDGCGNSAGCEECPLRRGTRRNARDRRAAPGN